MAGVKGSFAENYLTKNDIQHGMPFKYPSKYGPTTTSTTTENIVQEVITTTVESTTKIRDIITDIFTNSNNTQDAIGTNNTAIDENVISNSTLNTGGLNTDNVLNTTNDAGFTVDSISTTTQSVLDWVTKSVTDITAPDVRDDGNVTTSEHDMYTNYHSTSYIIMGVLIGILIIIGIGLIAVYVSYKKKNLAHISGQYHNQASREIPTSSMRDLEDIKVDHQKH